MRNVLSFLVTGLIFTSQSHGAAIGDFVTVTCRANGSSVVTHGTVAGDMRIVPDAPEVVYEFKIQPISIQWSRVENPLCSYRYKFGSSEYNADFNSITLSSKLSTQTMLCGVGSSYSIYPAKADLLAEFTNYTVNRAGERVRVTSNHISDPSCLVDELK